MDGEVGLVAVMDIDRRPLVLGEDTTESSGRSSGRRSLCFMNPGEGDRDFWNVDSFQSKWSNPRPTSAFSVVVGEGIHGGVGRGGSDIFVVDCRERPFKEPIERRAFSFLTGPPSVLSGVGLC